LRSKLYDKKFRENLKAQTPFVACSERLDLPMKSGNQYEINIIVPYLEKIRLYRWNSAIMADNTEERPPSLTLRVLNARGVSVTTNTPNMDESVLKIESELTGDCESEPAVT